MYKVKKIYNQKTKRKNKKDLQFNQRFVKVYCRTRTLKVK